MEKLRIPPESLEAETCVLGTIIMGSMERVIDKVAPILKVEYFYRLHNQYVYEAMLECAEKNINVDLPMLQELLQKAGRLEFVGGVDYLIQLAESTPGAANAEYYARIVRDRAFLRQLIQMADKVLDDCYVVRAEPREIAAAADECLSAILTTTAESTITTAAEIIEGVHDEIIDRKEGELRGLPTGFHGIDDKTHGLKPGEITIIAARTSMGKTAFLLNIIEHLSVEQGHPVAVFSLEMTDRALVERIFGCNAKVNIHSVNNGTLSVMDRQNMEAAVARIKRSQIYIENNRNLTSVILRSSARRLVNQYGVKMIAIDYLQLIKTPASSEQRYVALGEISRQLKLLAIELNIPIVVLSQLNRTTEEQKRPRISNLRESGAIEQDSDVVLLIHRENYYKAGTPDDEADIIIGKNRNGPTGEVKLTWLPHWTKFDNRVWIPNSGVFDHE